MKLFVIALFAASASAIPVADGEEDAAGPFAPTFYSGIPVSSFNAAYSYGLPATDGYGLPAYFYPYYANNLLTPAGVTKRSAEPEPLYGVARRTARRGARRRTYYVSKRVGRSADPDPEPIWPFGVARRAGRRAARRTYRRRNYYLG